jgi:small subunit ribosomal protein S1
MTEVSGGRARVELGEGIQATCRIEGETAASEQNQGEAKADVLSLGSMLASKWKGGQAGPKGKREPARAGQIRSFRIVKLDAGAKRIELELA